MLLQIMFLLLAVMLPQSQVQGGGAVIGLLDEELKATIVNMHNSVRRAVQPTARNMFKMEWSEAAANNAKQWLKSCPAAGSSITERIIDGIVCGEIVLLTNYPTNWSNTIDRFSSGQKYFKYGIGKLDSEKDVYGYTQMIWHDSYQVGCANAICPMAKKQFFHICRYCPSGNLIAQLKTPYKEGPPCGDCPDSCEDKLCTNYCMYTDKYDTCSDLLQMYSCDEKFLQESCGATCNCPKKKSS